MTHPKELLDALEGVAQEGDLVILAGAGDIGHVAQDVAARIAQEGNA